MNNEIESAMKKLGGAGAVGGVGAVGGGGDGGAEPARS
jgi:hypothetical protein